MHRVIKKAKKAETMNVDTEQLYSLYETAYQKALNLVDLIDNAENTANFLKRKATRKEIFNRVVGIVGIGSFIFSIITVVFF